MNDNCHNWEIDERFRRLFPNGLTQEQVDAANQEMWRDNTFYCGKCKRHIHVSQYPHDCPVNKE